MLIVARLKLAIGLILEAQQEASDRKLVCWLILFIDVSSPLQENCFLENIVPI